MREEAIQNVSMRKHANFYFAVTTAREKKHLVSLDDPIQAIV
jgi:hypothetical protein